MMVDDRDARIAQLEAENAALRAKDERRDRALAEALEQQTATAEVLRIIASSPTNLSGVLQAIALGVARVCRVGQVNIFRRVGDELVHAAKLEDKGPIPLGGRLIPTRDTVAGRVFLKGTPLHIHDMAAALDDFRGSHRSQTGDGYRPRTHAAFPLRVADVIMGVLIATRGEVEPFTEA